MSALQITEAQLIKVQRTRMRNRIWKATGYEPHGKQLEIHNAIARGARYVIAPAGTRAGKTRMLSTELLTEMGFPPPKGATHRLVQIAAPYVSLTDKCFLWCWDAIVTHNLFGVQPIGKSLRSRYIEMPWGSKLVGNSMDNPDSALGDGVVFSACDEFARFPSGIFESHIERALMDHQGTAVCISTPTGMNHMYSKFEEWMRAMLDGDPLYFASKFTSYDNPHLPDGEVDRIRQRLEAAGCLDIFLQEYMAEFTAMSGSVWPQFDTAFHVGDVPYIPELQVILGIDFGFNNPACVEFGQVVGGERLQIFDEIHSSGLAPSELPQLIIKKLESYGIDHLNSDQYKIAYCDPSGAGEKAELRKFDLRNKSQTSAGKPVNDVNAGIITIRALLAREELPGLFIDAKKCPHAVRTIPLYHYKEHKGVAERTSDLDRPVKKDDHACDALRYMGYGELGNLISLEWLREIAA